MIGKLKGLIDSRGEDWVIIDVGGVGYEVTCSTRTLASLPKNGECVTLSIETYVREDQIRLFGFASDLERTWFRLLQSVQGVGAKVALAIQGTLSPAELTNAIALQDKAQVARSPGVGPKVAGRIVAELKDKVLTLSAVDIGGVPVGDIVELPQENTAAADAVSALTNLGYIPAQASAAISLAAKQAGEQAKAEDLIRIGLKELAK